MQYFLCFGTIAEHCKRDSIQIFVTILARHNWRRCTIIWLTFAAKTTQMHAMQLPCVTVMKKISFQLWTQTTSVPILYFFPSNDVWGKLWVIQTRKRLIISTLSARQRWELSNLMLGRKGLFASCKSRLIFCKKNCNAGCRSHPQPTSLLSYCTAISSRATGFSHCRNNRIVTPQLDSVWHLFNTWDTAGQADSH